MAPFHGRLWHLQESNSQSPNAFLPLHSSTPALRIFSWFMTYTISVFAKFAKAVSFAIHQAEEMKRKLVMSHDQVCEWMIKSNQTYTPPLLTLGHLSLSKIRMWKEVADLRNGFLTFFECFPPHTRTCSHTHSDRRRPDAGVWSAATKSECVRKTNTDLCSESQIQVLWPAGDGQML